MVARQHFLSVNFLLTVVLSAFHHHFVASFGFGLPSSSRRLRPSFTTTTATFGHRKIQYYHQGRSSLTWRLPLSKQEDDDDDDDEDMDIDEEDTDDFVVLPGGGMEESLTAQELEGLTVTQLKQQLRLRGMKVGGRKAELMERLLGNTEVGGGATSSYSQSPYPGVPSHAALFGDGDNNDDDNQNEAKNNIPEKNTKAQEFAQQRGKELVDITEYLDEKDKGKTVKTWKGNTVVDAEFEREDDDDDDDDDDESTAKKKKNDGENKAEVWGSEARIVDDYEGRRVVVDCLSRTVVEFVGSNQSYVNAFVVASRDALKPFLAGGGSTLKNKTSTEEQLREIQTKREQAHRTPVRSYEEDEGLDEGDESGIYSNIVDRDFSDWGKYTATGAQLSANEVQGVLLLSDVYGAFAEDTQTLAEKIAFECQPVVVMVPDLFRGQPWKEEAASPGKNALGQTYEQWRATHDDMRVSIDIRAAAACLRERYGVSSVVLWGTCFGGGRALEAAAGYRPGGRIHDVDGTVGPPLVNPMAVVAWYPTRYDASALFGKHRTVDKREIDGEGQDFAIMGVFAGKDELPGATPEDAATLKTLLEEDDRVKDSMVKVFPGQGHGFAHIGLAARANMDKDTAYERFIDDEFGGAGQISFDEGDSDVACLLSTAFMETYSRVFLPTVGPPIGKEEEWGAELEMKDLTGTIGRDVREEIKKSTESYVQDPLEEGRTINRSDDALHQEDMIKYLREAANEMGIKVSDNDGLAELYEKCLSAEAGFELF